MAEIIKAYNPADANKIETVLILKQTRIKPLGEEKSRRALPGEKYQISGIDKIELLARGLATLDLKAELPESKKKQAPKPVIKESFSKK